MKAVLEFDFDNPQDAEEYSLYSKSRDNRNHIEFLVKCLEAFQEKPNENFMEQTIHAPIEIASIIKSYLRQHILDRSPPP